MGPPADLLDCPSGFQLGDLFVHVTGRDKALHTWNNVAVRQNGDKLFSPQQQVGRILMCIHRIPSCHLHSPLGDSFCGSQAKQLDNRRLHLWSLDDVSMRLRHRTWTVRGPSVVY